MGIDKSLFWQKVEKEHDRARAFCFRLAGNVEDGDDLYQEAIIRAFHGMHGLRRPEAFRYWLYRIIGNAYKSRFRSPWWRRLVFGADVNMETSPAENPSGLYAARRRLDRAFSALTPDDRILVTLCELEGWKIAEAAELMSQTEGQAKTRLSRARKKMRQKLVALYGTQGANNMGENELYELSTGTKKTD